MPCKTLTLVLGITLVCCLGSAAVHARWIARLVPNAAYSDYTLRVKVRLETVGRSAPHITLLDLGILNQTDSPVTILWNESTFRVLRPLGRSERILPFRHWDAETMKTTIPARSSIVQKIGPAPPANIESWLHMIQVTEESTLSLVLKVETPEGSHQEEWTWRFRFIEEEPEGEETLWLTIAVAAAVLFGIVVLLPILRS